MTENLFQAKAPSEHLKQQQSVAFAQLLVQQRLIALVQFVQRIVERQCRLRQPVPRCGQTRAPRVSSAQTKRCVHPAVRHSVEGRCGSPVGPFRQLIVAKVVSSTALGECKAQNLPATNQLCNFARNAHRRTGLHVFGQFQCQYPLTSPGNSHQSITTNHENRVQQDLTLRTEEEQRWTGEESATKKQRLRLDKCLPLPSQYHRGIVEAGRSSQSPGLDRPEHLHREWPQ